MGEDFLRRAIDVVASTLGLLFLAPILAVIGVAIKRDSPGSVVFTQPRVGQHGKLFTLYKFRTMTAADAVGPAVTASGDARITRVGQRLRSTKLDELPQLINVARGDMSLVGPRPEVPQYAAHWPPEAAEVILSVKPGITDPMTVELRREEAILATQADPEAYYIRELLPKKAQAYVSYVRNRTILTDMRVLTDTLRAIVRD